MLYIKIYAIVLTTMPNIGKFSLLTQRKCHFSDICQKMANMYSRNAKKTANLFLSTLLHKAHYIAPIKYSICIDAIIPIPDIRLLYHYI